MVARRTSLLTVLSRSRWPYIRYSRIVQNASAQTQDTENPNRLETESSRVVRWVAKALHSSKKAVLSSIPSFEIQQFGSLTSAKLCRYLCARRALSPSLSWVKNRRPAGWWFSQTKALSKIAILRKEIINKPVTWALAKGHEKENYTAIQTFEHLYEMETSS